MTTRTFTRDQLDEMDLPWKGVHTEQIDSGRWESFHVVVFQHLGLFWQVEYRLPLTEMQEDPYMYPWPEDESIVATQVHPVEVTTTRWEPVD